MVYRKTVRFIVYNCVMRITSFYLSVTWSEMSIWKPKETFVIMFLNLHFEYRGRKEATVHLVRCAKKSMQNLSLGLVERRTSKGNYIEPNYVSWTSDYFGEYVYLEMVYATFTMWNMELDNDTYCCQISHSAPTAIYIYFFFTLGALSAKKIWKPDRKCFAVGTIHNVLVFLW